jgi:hypothetical protein
MRWGFGLLILLHSSQLRAEGIENPASPKVADPLASSPVLYQFHENLSKAEALILQDGKELVEIWEQDRFFLPRFGAHTQIKTATQLYNRAAELGIFFPPIPKAVRRLRFRDVPPGSTIILFYGIDDEGFKEPEDTYVYFRIWVGRHELKRLRIPHEKGWKTETVDLGVLSFLKHNLAVTFEITSDSNKSSRLSFRAEIRQ